MAKEKKVYSTFFFAVVEVGTPDLTYIIHYPYQLS